MAPLLLDAVPPAVHLLGLALIFVIIVSIRANKNRQLPLPPGPRAWPVVGNLLDVPRKRAFFEYSKWASDYGSDILFMQLPSQPVIIVNTVEAANDLMYKRSSIYSDKPQTIMDELLVADVIMDVTYGIKIKGMDDPFVTEIQDAIVSFNQMKNDGVAPPSVMQSLVRTIQQRYTVGSVEYAEHENYVKDAGATAYGGQYANPFKLLSSLI
ncbi:hypothetical protein EIP86_002189 [Pleurotus ostreatoroseus]|nr:hypothetical protein EIP86_002189 [Pleurotus ostreatoroseus]